MKNKPKFKIWSILYLFDLLVSTEQWIHSIPLENTRRLRILAFIVEICVIHSLTTRLLYICMPVHVLADLMGFIVGIILVYHVVLICDPYVRNWKETYKLYKVTREIQQAQEQQEADSEYKENTLVIAATETKEPEEREVDDNNNNNKEIKRATETKTTTANTTLVVDNRYYRQQCIARGYKLQPSIVRTQKV